MDTLGYVQETLDKFSCILDVTTSTKNMSSDIINSALLNYESLSRGLLLEYQKVKIAYIESQTSFKRWEDEKFIIVKKDLFNEYATSKIKNKPSLSEIQTEMRTRYRDEYDNLHSAMINAEAKKSFILRLMDIYKKLDMVLVTLSKNIRTEMETLSLSSRLDHIPKQRFPVRKSVNTNSTSSR